MERTSATLLGTLAVALAAIGWGTWALFLRGTGVPPVWQSILILSVITLAWLPLALRSRRGPRPARAWRDMALLGAFDAGNYILYFAAVDRGPIALAVLTHYLAPVLVAAGAPFILAEPLGRRTLPAAALALIGVAMLLGGVQTDGGVLVTALLGAGSAAFYAASALWSKKLFEHFTGTELLCYHAGISALLLLPFAGRPPPLDSMIGRPLVGALLAGAGGGALFYFGLRRIEAQRAAVLTYLEPLVAALVGALAFGEAHTPLALVGAALVLASGAAVALQK